MVEVTELTISRSLAPYLRDHIYQYLENGDAAHDWDLSNAGGGGKGIIHTLLLITTGRKSEKKLPVPLLYQPTGTGSFCIIGSRRGSPHDPAWFLNLQVNPNAEIKVRNDWFNVVARVPEGKEREVLWQMMVDYFPQYANYQKGVDRQIPVIVLDPV